MDRRACKHVGKFYCTTVTVEEGSTYAFACLQHCGFWLNFDPGFAGHVRDIPADAKHGDDMWRIVTVAFHPFPSPTREWKTPQPMAVEGTKMTKGKFQLFKLPLQLTIRRNAPTGFCGLLEGIL